MATTQAPSQVSFPRFREFPVEIKCEVFKLAMPDERVIEIFYDPIRQRFTTDANPPALLHVCQASRMEALKVFKALDVQIPSLKCDVESQFSHEELLAQLHRRDFQPNVMLPFKTYVNWDLDTFSLSPKHFQSRGQARYPFHLGNFLSGLAGNAEISNKLQHLAFEAKTFTAFVMSGPISKLHALQSIKFIVGDQCCERQFIGRDCVMHQDIVAKQTHSKLHGFEEVEEPEDAIMNNQDRQRLMELTREKVMDGADLKLAFFLVEKLGKDLISDLGRRAQKQNAAEDGIRLDWEDFEVEIVTAVRGYGTVSRGTGNDFERYETQDGCAVTEER